MVSSIVLPIYSLVWIDAAVHLDEICYVQQQLRSTCNHVKLFENDDECKMYIQQSKDNEILLIIGEQSGSILIPLIHSLRPINSIYIYGTNLNKRLEWARKFIKVPTVIRNVDELIEKFQKDQEKRVRFAHEPLPVSIFNLNHNEERSSTNINGGFLHFQLFIDGLLHCQYNQSDRNAFFDLCEKEYVNNDTQLSTLQQFKDSYVPEKALYWYTRDIFIYRILNKALRVQNTHILFQFRFFIQDMYIQLKKLQHQQDQIPIRVYRGQLLSKQELDVLKTSKGQLISMNSFLSTTLDRQMSLFFVSSKDDDLCRVLFEINIDPQVSSISKPFANISSQSHFADEQEILFMIASTFQMIDISQENELTIIKMNLYNENYGRNVKLLFEHMQKEIGIDNECLSLGHILRRAGMYDKAEEFYNRKLNELGNDHPLIADLYGSIGLVRKAKGDIEISSQWFNKAFEMYTCMGDNRGIATCLQDLGDIERMKGKFHEATKNQHQALHIFKTLLGNQNESVANCLNNLGVNHFQQEQFTQAIECYMNALNIRKTILPHIHPDIARSLNNIGNVYFSSNKYDQALHYFRQALDIFEISLPSEHPSIAQTYYNMGLTYLKNSDYQRSLIFVNRAVSIYQNTLPSDHIEIKRCISTIDYIKQKYSQIEK
ncbi:hypothetical protein I4U23_031391 [Adineta vaga]|nr:hypothetical protein I4U23_031391 [Adineta vaga]